MNRKEFYQGEIRQVTFLVTINGRPRDLSNDDISLVIKRHPDDQTPISVKRYADFYMAYGAMGLASVVLTHQDLADEPGTYYLQLKVTDENGMIRKSQIMEVEIKESLDKTYRLETDVVSLSGAGTVELGVA